MSAGGPRVRVLGVDPGGQYTGVVVREGDRLQYTTCVARGDRPLDVYLAAVLTELTDVEWQHEPSLVAVEGVHAPTPHMGTISLQGLVGCSAVMGAVVGWARICRALDCVVVPPGGHGAAPKAAYPSALVGRRPKVHPGSGPRSHEQSAWDVAGAGVTLARIRRAS